MQQQVLRKSIAEWRGRAGAQQPRRRESRLRRFSPLLTVALVLAAWQAVALAELYPSFIVPAPRAVMNKFFTVLLDGRLGQHASTTLVEVLLGLGVGLLVGVTLGYFIAHNRLLEDLLSPVIVAFQATPVIAYAPLLVIWFGSGLESKVITSALIVFFPMLMNTIVGIRSVPPALVDWMHAAQATPRQMLLKLEIPAALPVLLSGLKISATLAVIGAVVGEFVSAKSGLGYLIVVARNQYDTPLVLVAVMTLTALALTLYGLVALLERRFLAWQRRARYE